MHLFAIMEHPSLSQSTSTFATLWIWADCQLVCNFADDVVVDPCMLCYCSCHVKLAFCVFLMGVCLACHDLLCSECIELVNMPTWVMFQHVPVFTKSENWLCFCHVHMLANVFSDPFWLKVTKGLLLSSLSSSMPCFTLPCSGPVACSFVAPKSATWSEIPDKCWFH